MVIGTWATFIAARHRIRAEGLTLVNPTTGHVGTHPAVHVAASAARDLLKFASQFGLTPLAEVCLGKPPVSDTR
jgi:phage terminase small subunit